jgi:hypothetical protein
VPALALLAAATLLLASAAPLPAAVPSSSGMTVDLLDPPVAPGQSVKVSVSVQIMNLTAIDQVQELFEVTGYLIARWKDARLISRAEADIDGIVHLKPDQVWTPEFTMVNAVEPRTTAQVNITVDRKGVLTYVEHFDATLSARFHLRRLPFDTQQLGIRIQPMLDEVDAVAFSVDDGESGISEELKQYGSVEDWQIGGFGWELRNVHIVNRAYAPEVVFSITVSRKYAFYLWKVFVPLILMVLVSWAVFWVEVLDLSNQVQIGITAMLTVIAFGLAVSYTLPRVPYLTYTDAFFLQCYMFVFIAILELMAVHVTHKERQKADLGRRIRRNSRWAVPTAFVLSNLWVAWYFLG